MSYYRIVNGKKYEATALINIEFRLRGAGDGRISKAEAQEVWRIAMDGGRLTEIEEETLRYAMNHYNFTDAAKEWLTEALEQEAQKVSSFYKIIDGLKYDRAILEKAEELTAGRGDGRISLEDAQFLWPMFGDAGDIRIEEERTLQYLRAQYSWTEKAEEWFTPKAEAISKESDIIGLIRYIIETEFRLERLFFEYDPAELRNQILNLSNSVNFQSALRQLLSNLLTDISQNSLGNWVMNIFELYPEVPNYKELIEGKIREFFANSRLILIRDESMLSEDDQIYGLPANGESITENWILGVYLEDLSDAFIWGIIPRDGSRTAYHYLVN